jgi:hypothetical protein
MRNKRYTSEELLKLYQAGERNFRKADLRNQSFKGQDLSGIDLEGANIQGADFTNAILTGANLRSVIGGLHWNPTFRKTSFRNADLTDADCTLAVFGNIDFKRAIFNRECWHQAQKVGCVRHPSFSQSKPRHRQPKWQGGTVSRLKILLLLVSGVLSCLFSIYGFLYMGDTPSDNEIVTQLLCLLLGVMGLVCFWQAWTINQSYHALEHNGQFTPGVITDLWVERDEDNWQDLYFVAYQFADRFQAYQLFRPAFGSAFEGLLPTKLDIGDQVTVRYVVTNPKFSRIEEWNKR